MVGLFTPAPPQHVSNALCYDIMTATTSLGYRNFSALLYSLMGPLSYMWPAGDRNVVVQRRTVLLLALPNCYTTARMTLQTMQRKSGYSLLLPPQPCPAP